MHLGRSGPPPPRRRPDRRDVGHDRLEHGRVVDVGGGHHHGQREPAGIADQVELASRLATVDWICAHVVPPRRARTLMVSTLARDQSTWPCSPRRSKTCRWSWSKTPALAHSVRRRQQVAGEPQPRSRAGSSRQGVEVRAMCTRSRPNTPGRRWCGADRHRAGAAGPAARAPRSPTARPIRGRQQGLSWPRILPDQSQKGAAGRGQGQVASHRCTRPAPDDSLRLRPRAR
jgi:hypothetical protein